ncbi:MAG: sulfide/dihydroorotate dehydrogenase-like FAD/NAD-binding protein [Candidatus Aminicenantes bacterium]|nr:sulfide/dihydroorotate dehydrogenase-like FAD/NAD-binding protein [Candidatus Aminicenantes bacterium]
MPARILNKERLAPSITRIVLDAPLIARKHRAGQFVILRVSPTGERIPLTVLDKDPAAGTIAIVFQVVGKSTMMLEDLEAGQEVLDLVGPLGRPTEVHNFGHAVCIAGGVGNACVYPIAKALKEAGNHVVSILGGRTAEHLTLESEFAATSDRLDICTDDGSKGLHGFVSHRFLQMLEAREKVDYVLAVGPILMMKAICDITRERAIKTVVSLNAVMVDGTGMCGSCRVQVAGKTRFACVDGPEFDGADVDFKNLISRLRAYKAMEDESRELYAAHRHACEERARAEAASGSQP